MGRWEEGANFPCLNGAESIIYYAFFPNLVVAASVKPWWLAPQIATFLFHALRYFKYISISFLRFT